jgi:predicted HAD superfamily Cof-like phosphohydrolase
MSLCCSVRNHYPCPGCLGAAYDEIDRLKAGRIRTQVSAFHRAMGQPILDKPQVPCNDRIRLRLKLIVEELFELLDACDVSFIRTRQEETVFESINRAIENHMITVDLPEVADALGDLDYVIEGTRLEFGINGAPIADAIHKSNLAKTDGPISPSGKKLKPPGWTPPDIAGELKKQGWEG